MRRIASESNCIITISPIYFTSISIGGDSMRPVPTSENPAQYEAEVTVTFHFTLTADDDFQAEELASYEWQDNVYRGEIDNIRVS